MMALLMVVLPVVVEVLVLVLVLALVQEVVVVVSALVLVLVLVVVVPTAAVLVWVPTTLVVAWPVDMCPRHRRCYWQGRAKHRVVPRLELIAATQDHRRLPCSRKTTKGSR